ncbi:hypothetical protein F2Q68_00035079 [Brassica cretica]|uniref:Uncharacterized protein n=1 Tax=Brassica cretica TaxID=69181 RepID=A0A8S9H9X8_BRACR|nr:hypothetical protein F2Q68_00035079 [Brassica cretica]
MSFSDETFQRLDKILHSLKQMTVDRNLREELRLDSQKLREEFRKRRYGESQAHNVFIPRRFEDLKLNGGSKLRRIPIKLNYHRSRFKKLKSKSPRRTLDSNGWLDRTGLATFQRRCVGMKKQYHQKKRTAQVKLAQACKSLGMFLVSPSFRDPKDCTKICVVKRQVIDTGVRPETHLFWYEFTSYEPTDIDGHVDTRIGDQSIFAEDVTALEHDDPDATMESLKDETIMESEPEITRKCKSVIEPSQIQQKRGKQGFHKVRFKARLHRRSKASAEKVTKGKEPFMMGNSESFHTGGSKYTRRLFVKWCYYKARENGKSHRRAQQALSLFSGKIKGKPPEGVSGNRREALEYEIFVSENGRFNLELLDGSGTDNFSFSTCVKKQTWSLVKTFCGRQLSEICLAVQVWEPGGDSDKRVQFMKKPLEPLWSFVVDSSQRLSLLFVKWKSKLVRLYAEAKSLRRSRLERPYCQWRYCEGAGSQAPNVDDNRVWNPGAVEVEGDKSCSSVIAEKLWNAENRKIYVMDVHTNSENEVKWVVVLSVTLTLESQKSFSSPEYVITVQAFCFWSLEDKAAILSGSRLKFYGEKIEWICGVWDPGVAGYGQAKEVRKLDNLSLTEACKRTYAGISYTGAAVGDVWGIIAHIKKFLVIEKGFGVEFMGSRNYVTKGIWSCFWILVKFNILCHCVRNVCVSRSLRPTVDVTKAHQRAQYSGLAVSEHYEGFSSSTILRSDRNSERIGLARQETTTSEEEDDVGAVSRDETGLILALVSLRFLDVRIHPKNTTANPGSRRRRRRGSRRERRGLAPSPRKMTRAEVNWDDLRIGDRARGVLGEKSLGISSILCFHRDVCFSNSTTGDVITAQEHHSSGLCVQGRCVLGLASNRFSEPLPDSLDHCSKTMNTKSRMFLCSRPDHDNSTSENVITNQEHYSSGAILVPVVASTSRFFKLTREPIEVQAHDAHELARNSS